MLAVGRLSELGLEIEAIIRHCRLTIEELLPDITMLSEESDSKATAYEFDGVVYELSDFGYVQSHRTLEEITED